jgi:hypothetical protein
MHTRLKVFILISGILLMSFGWDWNKGVANYLTYLTTTIDLTIPSFNKKSKIKQKVIIILLKYRS